MKIKNLFLSIIATALIAISCTTPTVKKVSIIPKPVSLELTQGFFAINSSTAIVVNSDDESVVKVADYLVEALDGIVGAKLAVASGNVAGIIINIDDSLATEAYKLEVTKESIVINASGSKGVFYGIQSLLQAIQTTNVKLGKTVNVPCLVINDEPAFAWRGMHLDVSRHFMTKDEVIKYIDIIAMHKLNIFHWHLTDDHGWRIEIKKYPKLTEIGAWRDDRRDETWAIDDDQRLPYDESKPQYGGFYTQEEVKEVLAYAADRQITIIPEIEMPGHSRAALVAYPELSCFGYETKLPVGAFCAPNWDFSDPFCAGKEETFEFFQDVLDEVMTLFPSEYIHIGGDECSKKRWSQCSECQARIKAEGLKDEFELQSYFIKRMEKYINSKGRKIIGWQEVLEGGMDPSAAIMPWKEESALEVCIEAAKGGHEVLMAPSSHLYFNSDWEGEKNVQGMALSLEKVYSYNPIPEGLDKEYKSAITGVQGCVWSEYTQTFEDVEYQTMPRMAALSEVAWTKKEDKNWDDFIVRLDGVKAIYKSMNISYYVPTPSGPVAKTIFINNAVVKFDSSSVGTVIKYTTDGSVPTDNSKEYVSEFEVTETTTVIAASFDQYGQKSKIVTALFEKQDFRKGDVLDNPKAGVNYKAFDGRFRSATLVEGTPVKTGTIETVRVVDINEASDAGLIIEGYIKVSDKAIFTFYLASNDGSILYIDDKVVVDNDGYRGAFDRYDNYIYTPGQVALDEGFHPFKIKYFDWGTGELLKLFIDNQDGDKIEVTKDMLFH